MNLIPIISLFLIVSSFPVSSRKMNVKGNKKFVNDSIFSDLELPFEECDGFININEFINKPSVYRSGSSSDSSRKVTSSDLKENQVTDVNSYKGLKLGTFESDEWRGLNLISRYLKITVNKIKKVNGVYSHFSSYFDYNVLKSGSAKSTIESSNSYNDTFVESLSFTDNVNVHAETKIESLAEIDVVSGNSGMSVKSGASFAYKCNYTRSTTHSYKWTDTFQLSSDTAEYCPDGYGLSIGKQGTFYYVEGQYQEMSIWWWGKYPTQGTSLQNFKCVIANPADFINCFVYKSKNDTSKDYYN